MNLWPQLRALAFLRRIARAAESIAESQATLARIATSDWELRHPLRRKAPAEIGTLNVAALEAEWREEQEAIEEARQ